MKRDLIIAGLLVALVLGIAAGWVIKSRGVDRPAVAVAPEPAAPRGLPKVEVAPLEPLPKQGPPAVSVPASATVNVAAPRQAALVKLAPAPQAVEKPMTQPVAREALGRVGLDADAEAVYIMAINDTNFSAEFRKNLIEDLNEDGFADPKNLTADDLPVIDHRLALIERLAPDAIDDANAAAFREAYKDLTNMRAKLTGQ